MATITPVTLENLRNLGIDKAHHLYWNGEQLVTISLIQIPTLINVAIGLGAAATFGLFVLALLQQLGWIKSPQPTVNVTINLPEEMRSKADRTSDEETS